MLQRLFSASLLLLFLGGLVWAQSLADGQEALDRKYREYRTLIPQLFKGEVQVNPSDKQQAEAVDVEAKLVTYPLNSSRNETQPGKIDDVFRSLDNDLKLIERNKPNTQGVAQMYAQQVRVHALEVINFDQASMLARVNATRVLARIASQGQPELADDLARLLGDQNQSEGVRYWALRALRELMAVPTQNPPLLSREREEKCLAAVVPLVERTQTFPVNAQQQEVEGFRILRREGVRALAQTRYPALGQVRPALALLRIAAADTRVAPAPRLDERLEAVVGLAQMRPELTPDYQQDLAAFYIARFVREFARLANDQQNAKGLDRTEPWRIDGARLGEALTAMKAGTKNAYVSKVADQCLPVVAAIEKGTTANPGDLSDWLANNAPTSTQLFKGVPESTVQAPQAAQ